MRHDFSSQYLRINPPDTSFGDAWESFCFELTLAESDDRSLMRLRPPDCGIDFLSRDRKEAYQCKSDERGAFGSMSAGPSIESLKSAVETDLEWHIYTFATNADYTGKAIESIEAAASAQGIDKNRLRFLGPNHWDRLCQKHPHVITDRLDYRVSLSEAQVIQMLRKAGYFEKYVLEAADFITNNPEEIRIGNNRTPVELRIPFSPDLTLRKLFDVAKTALGISLEWHNFFDTKTSCGPAISLTVDRISLGDKKISELTESEKNKLEIFIQLRWRDNTDEVGENVSANCYRLMRFETIDRNLLPESKRRELTLSRTEQLIQSQIWKALANLHDHSDQVYKRTDSEG